MLLNIDGLSEATLEKLIDQGFIHEYADLFRLDRYKEVITGMEGFGEKSYQNMMDSIETARHTTLPRLIYGLGIAGIAWPMPRCCAGILITIWNECRQRTKKH